MVSKRVWLTLIIYKHFCTTRTFRGCQLTTVFGSTVFWRSSSRIFGSFLWRCHKVPGSLCMDLWVKKWSELRAIGAWSSSRECGKPCLECALSFLSFCEKWAGADPIVICELICLLSFQLVLQIFATILGKKQHSEFKYTGSPRLTYTVL